MAADPPGGGLALVRGQPLMGAGEFGCEVVGPVHVVGRDAGHAPPHQEVDNRRALGAGQADDVNVLSFKILDDVVDAHL